MVEEMESDKNFSIFNLLREGTIRIAEKPKDNPKEIPQRGPYALFFMEEDYPGLTAAMWNRVSRDFNFDFRIIMMVADPKDLPRILSVVKKEERIKGGVFGVGFKDEVVGHLDGLEPIVEAARSSNVFVKEESAKIIGYNTDALGFTRSLKEKLQELNRGTIEGKQVLVLGAGGTGSAIAYLLPEKGSRVVILNRTQEKAADLAKRINQYYKKEVARAGGEDLIESEIAQADIVINTTIKGASGPFQNFTALTPAGGEWGLEKNSSESERILQGLTHHPLICDIVLREKDTLTIALAKRFGLPTLDGRPMVLYQAIPAIKLVFPQVKSLSDKQIEETMRQAQAGI